MNKRIRELAEQATITEDYYPAGCNGYPEYSYYFDEEKFAQLLLEEVSQHLTNKGLDHSREVIEKEFGI